MTKASPVLPIGVVTFLFTDIVGSTAMAQRLGRTFDQVLADHDRIVRGAIGEAGGTVVRTEGDSFFAVFTTPDSCIECTVAAQRRLRDHVWPDGGRVEVRMGMHTGEGRLGGDDYVGIDVHRAARIAAAGHGGQILASEATAALTGPAPSGDVELRDLGEHWLKDMEVPDRLFQVTAPDLRSTFPALRTEKVPNNLPAQPSEFVGRSAEVASVAGLVSEHRIITVTGVGGVGKTRLAIEVAASVLDRFPGGAFFVPLAEVSEPERVLESIAVTLGASGDIDPVTSIVAAIGRRVVLVLLDNMEHVIAAASGLSRLLSACPTLTLLVTSRSVLHLAGERAFPLAPMGLPAGGDVGSVERSDGGILFVRRAQSADPSFRLDRDNASAIAAIVSRLDGLPLAIELAAARLRLFGTVGLLSELETRLPDLGGGYVDAPPRHRTLEAAIDWRYGLLEPHEQALLHWVSPFVGGFTLDAARAVVPGSVVPDVPATLASLIDKSLVQSSVVSGVTRFSTLETIRSYGLRRAEEADEADRVRREHAAYYIGMPVAAKEGFRGPGGYELVRRLRTERANLAAALEWSARSEPDLGLEAMLVLSRFYQATGLLDEGWAVARRLLDHPDSTPDRRLTGLLGAAAIAYWLLDYAGAERLYVEAVAVADRLGDRAGQGEAAFGLSYTYTWQGRLDEAEEAADRAMAPAEEAGDRVRIAHLLAVKGTCQWLRGNLVDAMHRFAEVRERAEREGLVELRMKAELVLAGGLVRAGRHREAVPYVLSLIERFDDIGDEGGLTEGLDYLSVAMTALTPEDGLRVAAAVRATAERRGGTIEMQALGIPDPRDLAIGVLGEAEVDRIWAEGSELELHAAVDVAWAWAARSGIHTEPVDVDRVVALVESAG